MRITTKQGDKGKTQLCWGKRVSKDHIRIEACGEIDELNSYLGALKSIVKSKKIKTLFTLIQRNLIILSTELVCEPKFINKVKKRINSKQVEALGSEIRKLERKCTQLEKAFHLPGKSLASSLLDISRCVARRAERRVVTLQKKKMVKNEFILIYLNRLSDLLYLLARLQ